MAEAARQPEVLPSDDPKISTDSAQQKWQVRRLHGHMKRDTSSLVAATLRTGFLVGFAVILILVLFPAIAAQAAGPR
jgi:hypothetical protein